MSLMRSGRRKEVLSHLETCPLKGVEWKIWNNQVLYLLLREVSMMILACEEFHRGFGCHIASDNI
jgi:hypothetical protein